MSQTMPFPRRPLPSFACVRQSLPTEHIADVRGEVTRALLEFGLRRRARAGMRVAITAGSRGIGGFLDLLGGTADAVRAAGGEPFIIPAMGSHGGATAEGQTEVLRRLGFTERAVGAPLHATMETRNLGPAENGAAAHLDRCAAEADGIIVLGRVKTHPESAGPLASGLLKMTVIGLGKQSGAQEAHSHGLWASVQAVGQVVLQRAPVLCGVAVVENGYRQPVVIEVVEPTYDSFLEADTRLLTTAKRHLGTIPFRELDVLVVDEVGKNISGSGMDLNVIGSWRASGGPRIPDFRRIVALSLTDASLGNGIGIGLADFTTRRFADAYDPAVSYVNILTATEPGGTTREGPMPLALGSDKQAIEVGLHSALAGPAPRMCRIPSTAALDTFWVSEALLGDVAQDRRLSVVSPPSPLPFDESGNLLP